MRSATQILALARRIMNLPVGHEDAKRREAVQLLKGLRDEIDRVIKDLEGDISRNGFW